MGKGHPLPEGENLLQLAGREGSRSILEVLLQRLDQTNLFVISLDRKREWYRYHTLFAQALRRQLEETQGDLILLLYYPASASPKEVLGHVIE